MIIDLHSIIREEKIQPQGVIHIGAHTGSELSLYEEISFKRVLMIEANPDVFQHLTTLKSDICDLISLNVAVSDKKGTAPFYITSDGKGEGEMSSSLLKLKEHKALYPDIYQDKTIETKTDRLDDILKANNLPYENYNMINIDIQGAELMAFKGSTKILPNIDIINTEINKTELYEGCTLLDELESFLSERGFYKHTEFCKYDPEWGDAVFLKK